MANCYFATATNYTMQDIRQITSSEELSSVFIRDKRIGTDHLLGLSAALSMFDDYPIFNHGIGDIDLGQIMENKDVVFFELDVKYSERLARAIGRLIAYDINTHCSDRSEKSDMFYFVCDEFKYMACKPFLNLMSMIRDAQIPMILCNTSIGDLEEISFPFKKSVWINTYGKTIMGVTDPDDLDFLARGSGEVTYTSRGTSQFDKTGHDTEITILDGKTSNQGLVSDNNKKNFIDKNELLLLKDGIAARYERGKPASIVDIQHYYSLKEKNTIDASSMPEIVHNITDYKPFSSMEDLYLREYTELAREEKLKAKEAKEMLRAGAENDVSEEPVVLSGDIFALSEEVTG